MSDRTVEIRTEPQTVCSEVPCYTSRPSGKGAERCRDTAKQVIHTDIEGEKGIHTSLKRKLRPAGIPT